jgi:phage host-nuclease inhibitor protein Gam
MSKSKSKTETAVIATREEMAELAGDIAALQNELNRLTTVKNIELDIINKRYAEQLGRLDADIKVRMKLALDWCTRNEASEFRDWRTIDFQRATVQLRRGNWEVQLRSNWKIANVLTALKAFLIPGKPAGTRWVRTVEEVNKELIIQERGTLTDEQWHALGIKIVRGKSVIIEGKGDPVESKAKATSVGAPA